MKQKILSLATLALLFGTQLVGAAKIKSPEGGFLKPTTLAQAGCDIQNNLQFGGDNGALDSGELNRNILKANSAEVVVGLGTDTDTYMDHNCYEAHQNEHCDETQDTDSSTSSATRRRTTVYSGQIVYANEGKVVEQGSANQWEKACEEIDSDIYQTYASGDTPQACVQASVCP